MNGWCLAFPGGGFRCRVNRPVFILISKSFVTGIEVLEIPSKTEFSAMPMATMSTISLSPPTQSTWTSHRRLFTDSSKYVQPTPTNFAWAAVGKKKVG